MKLLLITGILVTSKLANALPECAAKYKGTRHDAEWGTLNRAFRNAAQVVRGVPFELLLAVGIVESGLNQKAVSHRDAVGIMQITTEAEEHIRMLQRHEGSRTRGPTKPYPILLRNKMSSNILTKARCVHNCRYNLEDNISLGAKYLQLGMQTADSLEGALIFYNGGYRQLDKFRQGDKVANETAQYVLRVLNLYKECSNG